MNEAEQSERITTDSILTITRPHDSLMTYYLLSSLAAGPFFPFILLPLYFRYHTMRYSFSEEGVSMRWGVLFRREINLTFARIQDIHLTSNVVERWLGLARIQIQTASGSSKAEMTIEGVREFRSLRDFLYSRMRGAKGLAHESSSSARSGPASASVRGESVGLDDVTAALRETIAELRELRAMLEQRGGGAHDG
jgi:putative membrane protein